MRYPRFKAAFLALFLALVVGFAFAMPITLQSGLIDRIGPVVRYFCPETGLFAPRYFHRRSGPETWQACLDQQGNRIEDRATHYAVVRSIGAFWTLFFFVPLWSIFTTLFRSGPASRRARTTYGA